MVYDLIKVLVRISTAIFFKKIVVVGRAYMPERGPAIIVANHPNTLMDPLLVALLADQRIGFVDNAGLFSNGFLVAFFRYFHVIPIYRKKDVAPGGKQDNTQAFAQCHAYLQQGGTFLIFPEGSSHYEINLREIKTGTARIALSYTGPGDVQIIPVALDYSDAIQFRSMVRVTVGKPIMVSAYKEDPQRNENEAVDALTDAIRKALAKKLPWTTGKDQEELLIKAHTFYTAYAAPEADLHENPKRSLLMRKQLADALHHLHRTQPEVYARTSAQILHFFDALRTDRITPGFHTDAYRRKSFALLALGYVAELAVMAPMYLFGLLTNYIPYILPSRVFKASGMEVEYKAPAQMILGLICFPLFYGLELWAFHRFIDPRMWTAALFLIALPIAGYTALWYWTELQRFARVLRFQFVVPKDRKDEMLRERDAILDAMAEARKSL
ncbi:MAG: 1-acyl-sn-glycerol-3-phosphate acyltransferase [Flavobacteriales bacterium]|nr:1-acyl-sn-glycerol-3-phosphate acyltransferase [Flavobacteriales bacterium]